jgi:hypothetical protein
VPLAADTESRANLPAAGAFRQGLHLQGAGEREMHADDRDYYLRRATEEDEAARVATSLVARWRHEELASLYRMRVLTFDRTVIEDETAGCTQPFILVPSRPEIEAA